MEKEFNKELAWRTGVYAPFTLGGEERYVELPILEIEILEEKVI